MKSIVSHSRSDLIRCRTPKKHLSVFGYPVRVHVEWLNVFFCRNGTCKKRCHSMLIGGGCQLQNVYRGSSANYHFEVCPAHAWLTGRCRATETINDLCDR